MVWGTFQLAAVKVIVLGLTVPSAVLELVIDGRTTGDVGWLVRTTVKLAVVPVSEVMSPVVEPVTIPSVSLSAFVIERLSMSSPSNSLSVSSR